MILFKRIEELKELRSIYPLFFILVIMVMQSLSLFTTLSYIHLSLILKSKRIFICLSIFVPEVCVNLAFQHFFLILSAF